MINYQLDITLKNRLILKNLFENYTTEQLNEIPDGFKNNVIWNVAHIITTQQLLVYNLSGLPMTLDDAFVNKYRKGTKPENNLDEEEINQIKNYLVSSIEQTLSDYRKGIFKNYNSYTTSTNTTISSVEDAICFNNFHEGIHLGYIMALKKHI